MPKSRPPPPAAAPEARAEPAPAAALPSGADRVKAIGEAAERLAERYAQAQTEGYRKRILADFETRRGHTRHIRRHLFEMARRFEDYQSVYDCARELRDFVETLGGPLKTRQKRPSG